MVGRWMKVMLAAAALCWLAGCNTVAGVGKDISDSAHAVQRAM
jgi:predicted small secreted protein